MKKIYILLLLCITGCTNNIGKDYSLDEKSFGTGSLKMVEHETGIDLPDGSRGLNMFYKGSQIDPSFVAKIEIPQSSQEAMTKQIEKIKNQSCHVTGSLTEKTTWWIPLKSKIITQRQFSVNNGDYVQLIFCRENDRLILYVEWIKI